MRATLRTYWRQWQWQWVSRGSWQRRSRGHWFGCFTAGRRQRQAFRFEASRATDGSYRFRIGGHGDRARRHGDYYERSNGWRGVSAGRAANRKNKPVSIRPG